MWVLNCGCNKPYFGPIIFDIPESVITLSRENNIKFPDLDKSDKTDCLKRKIIKEYLDILQNLECGIQPNIENILQEISLIDIKTNYNVW